MRWQKWRLKSTDNRKFSTETEASFFHFCRQAVDGWTGYLRKLASAGFGLRSTACKKKQRPERNNIHLILKTFVSTEYTANRGK